MNNTTISKKDWWSKITSEIDAQNLKQLTNKKLGWMRIIQIEPSESNQFRSENSY